MKYLLVVFALLCFAPITFAQHSKLDSLFLQLELANSDASSVQILNDLSFEFWDINPSEGLKYAKKALSLSEKIESEVGIANSYANMSRSYRRLTNLTKSLEFGFKSLSIFKKLGDLQGVGQNLVNIGNTYRVQKDYDLSLFYLRQALLLNLEIGNAEWIARTLNSIGNVFKDLKNVSIRPTTY